VGRLFVEGDTDFVSSLSPFPIAYDRSIFCLSFYFQCPKYPLNESPFDFYVRVSFFGLYFLFARPPPLQTFPWLVVGVSHEGRQLFLPSSEDELSCVEPLP